MNTRLAHASLVLSVLISGILTAGSARAGDHAAVMPFLSNDVVAVAYVDLKAIDVSALLDELRNMGTVPRDQWDDAANGAMKAQHWVSQLTGSGATRAYLVIRTSDIEHAGPCWVVPMARGADPKAFVQLIKGSFEGSRRPAFLPVEFQVVDGTVLAAMNKSQLERLASGRTDKPRDEVGKALDELGGGGIGLVVFGDADSRRVLREMLPRLPEPFRQIDGRMIADDVLWAGVAIDMPPKPRVSIHIETSGAEVARTMQGASVKALEFAKLVLMARLAKAPEEIPATGIMNAFGLLEPKVDGVAVKLTLGDDDQQLKLVRDLLTPNVNAAVEAAQRARRTNQMKQIALAFWNYESTNSVLVSQANYDQDGKPLLSWRVHLLPYLDQQGLYNEFHLDEPWDSEHNRSLISRMPEVYADPNGDVRTAAGPGRTTFVVPVAAETLFPPYDALPDGKPLRVRDVTDGTSKTLLFVEVVPQHAVEWTRPKDWNVDINHPLRGVKRTDRSGFIAARCDGSVQFISNDVDTQKMHALLTRASGDRVDE